jgi:KUP system potassium uptake protein
VQDVISPETELTSYESFIIKARVWLQNMSSNPASWFGLDFSNTVIERVPLILGSHKPFYINRIPADKYRKIKEKNDQQHM